MTLRRVIPMLAVLVVSALLVAGCGGSDGGDGGAAPAGSVPASASLAPADATAFVTVNTDVGSEAWADAGRLVDLIPGARKALDGIVADMDGVSWAKDVRPMLGPELVIVVTKGNDPIVLLQPKDEAAFRRVAASTDDPAVLGEVDGWSVAAESQTAIDAYRAALAKGTIEASDRFAAAMEGLPGDAMARAYVSGSNLMKSVRELAAVGGSGQEVAFDSMSMAVVPQRDGILVSADVRTPSGADGTTYEPKLLDRVPADAVMALSFGGTDATVDRLTDGVDLGGVSDALKDMTGVSLDGVMGLFSGEGMLYLRAGTTIPEVTLVLAPPDVDAAFTDVDTIVRSLAKGMDAEVTQTEQDGVTVYRADAGTVNVQYARVDDAVVVTTGASGIRLFREDGDKLRDAEPFRRAADKVGLRETTAGFLYVDVDGLIPLAEGLADTADTELPASARDAMEAFDSVILSAAGGEGSTTMSGFVAMNG